MKPTVRTAVRLMLLAVVGVAVAPAHEKRPEHTHVALQLPYRHQFQFAGYYAAQKMGYFERAGLTVEIREGSMEQLPVEEVLAGRAHYGVQSSELLLRRLQGADIVLVTAIYQHSPQAVFVPMNSEIRTPADLIGKRVAIGSRERFAEIWAMLVNEGLDEHEIIEVPNEPWVNELAEGLADAMTGFILDTPYYERVAGLPLRAIRPVAYGNDFYGDGLFTTGGRVESHPAEVLAMREAVRAGWRHALANPAEIIDHILTLETSRDRPAARAQLEYEAPQVARLIQNNLVEIGHSNPGRWSHIANTYVDLGLAPDTERLRGFLLPDEMPDELPGWVVWLAAGLGAALMIMLLVLLANRRLHRLVEHRTRELFAKEEHYRLLFELSPVALVEFDYLPLAGWFAELRRQGVTDLEQHFAAHPAARRQAIALSPLREANAATLRAVGAASRQELIERLPEVILPGTVAARLHNMVRLFRGLDHAEGEIPYRHLKTGETRYFHYFWRMPREADGTLSFRRTQTALLDVTEKRLAEKALRESEERYRSVFQTTPVPMWIYDLETLRFLAVNEAAVRNYGYSREEFLAMSIMEIRPPEERERLRQVIEEYRGGRPHREDIWRHVTKDGSVLLVEVYAHQITLDDRRAVLVVPFDLTAKLEAEEALRESEARYRALFENAAGGVYRSTADGRFLAVNQALARMLGFATPDEMIAWYGRGLDTKIYAKPGRRAEFIEQMGGQDSLTNFESEARGKDGKSVWISEDVHAVRDAEGNLLYFEGFVSDLTPRRQLESELQRASKLEAVGILAGGIAHDFNNILTVVLGNITLAELDVKTDATAGPLLREAKRATLRARDLTQQLLTFAKGGDPVRSAVNLSELLRESTGFALHGAKARGEFEVPDDLWPADADKGQLGQVIQNLVINSAQAMPEGGIVRISADNVTIDTGPGPGGLPAGRYVRIQVSDSGVGVAPEHLAKIFDPYFTTKQQGSGLGLATVYSIIRKHQGHVEVESQLGIGTTFRLWLPAAGAMPAPTEAPAGTASPFPLRVLFMDDEPTIRQMARLFLDRLGASCEVAADGNETLVKYRAGRDSGAPFDVVIMDLTVPGGMGGREAMEKLRAYDPDVKAIVSSGYSRDPVLANYRAHGFRGILPKPYGLAQLRRALQEITELQPVEKE